MWCAYAFAVIAFIGLPVALKPGGEGIIAAASSDTRSENTFKDAEAILSEALEIQKHLQAQDEELIAALKDALSKVPAQ